MPVDYFKISYDDEPVTSSSGSSSQQNYSNKQVTVVSDSEFEGRSLVLLRGWSQLNDLPLFMDVLSRVKATSKDRACPLKELAAYVNDVYSVCFTIDCYLIVLHVLKLQINEFDVGRYV